MRHDPASRFETLFRAGAFLPSSALDMARQSLISNRPVSFAGQTLGGTGGGFPTRPFDLKLSEASALAGLPGPWTRGILFVGLMTGVLALQVYFYVVFGEVLWPLVTVTGVLILVGGVLWGAACWHPIQRAARLLIVSGEGIDVQYDNGPTLALRWGALQNPLWILDRRGTARGVTNAECSLWGTSRGSSLFISGAAADPILESASRQENLSVGIDPKFTTRRFKAWQIAPLGPQHPDHGSPLAPGG